MEINEPGLSRPKKKQVDADGNPTLTRNAEDGKRDDTPMRTTIKIPVRVYEEARKLAYFEHVNMREQFQGSWCEFTDNGKHMPIWDEEERLEKEGEYQGVMVPLAIRVPKWLNQKTHDLKEGFGVNASQQFLMAWLDKYGSRKKEEETKKVEETKTGLWLPRNAREER